MRHLVIFNVLSLCLSSLGYAEWSSRNRLETGMTDNAQLTETNKESDFFLSVGTNNTFSFPDYALGFRLGYKDYSKDNSNDVLSWGLSDRLKCLGNKTCQVELKGQEYVYGDPGNTDSSFSNYGLALSLEKTNELQGAKFLTLLGAYELKNYYSQSRQDHLLYTRGTLGYDPNPLFTLEANGETGVVLSSQSEFSALYLEISGLVDYHLNRYWDLSGDTGVRQTQFLSRDLTTQTFITRQNGKTVSQTDTSKETYTLVYIAAEASRNLTTSSSARFSLQHSQQKSHSGYQDYSEMQILAKVLLTY